MSGILTKQHNYLCIQIQNYRKLQVKTNILNSIRFNGIYCRSALTETIVDCENAGNL